MFDKVDSSLNRSEEVDMLKNVHCTIIIMSPFSSDPVGDNAMDSVPPKQEKIG